MNITLLPENVRLEINRRLQAGESAAALAKWLNTLPEVQSGQAAVTAKDVSRWKQGGFRDGLAHAAALAGTSRVVAEAKELSAAAEGKLTDHLAAWTAGRYALVTRQLAREENAEAVDWNLLRMLCQDLVNLRSGDHRAEGLRIERERWEAEKADMEEELQKRVLEWVKENRDTICKNYKYKTDAEAIDEVRMALFGKLAD